MMGGGGAGGERNTVAHACLTPGAGAGPTTPDLGIFHCACVVHGSRCGCCSVGVLTPCDNGEREVKGQGISRSHLTWTVSANLWMNQLCCLRGGWVPRPPLVPSIRPRVYAYAPGVHMWRPTYAVFLCGVVTQCSFRCSLRTAPSDVNPVFLHKLNLLIIILTCLTDA